MVELTGQVSKMKGVVIVALCVCRMPVRVFASLYSFLSLSLKKIRILRCTKTKVFLTWSGYATFLGEDGLCAFIGDEKFRDLFCVEEGLPTSELLVGVLAANAWCQIWCSQFTIVIWFLQKATGPLQFTIYSVSSPEYM